MSLRHSPYVKFTLVWLVLAGAAFLSVWIQLHVFWVIDLLIAMNAAAFVLYGLDKLFAIMRTGRVPEKVLWLAAVAGGPLGAFGGMYAFRHKTSKVSFQFVLFLLLFAEIALVLYVYRTFVGS